MNMHRRIKASAAAAADKDAMPAAAALIALAALAALALTPAAALGAGAPAANGEKPVKLEAVAGTSAKRVLLTAKAAERLGIKTGTISESPIPNTRLFGGFVLPVPPAEEPLVPVAAAKAPEVGTAWIAVSMSQNDLAELAPDRPARIRTLSHAGADAALTAMPSRLRPVFDPKRHMLTLHYVAQNANLGLQPLQRVHVELELMDHNVRRKVAPTSAVFYMADGSATVYLNPAPLTYIREPVSVARIVGDMTVLEKGPPVGTAIVTLGAPLLYGTEVFGK